MKTSEKGIKMIAKFEGFKSCPYLDPVGIPTIGFGNTFYPNGIRVKMTDPKITRAQGLKMLKEVVKQFEGEINRVLCRELSQNQFDAIVSFTYNLGIGSLRRSTLLEKVNRNPCDPSIPDEFRKWTYAKGKRLNGLIKRRDIEAELYAE